jgi:hypothetical protein
VKELLCAQEKELVGAQKKKLVDAQEKKVVVGALVRSFRPLVGVACWRARPLLPPARSRRLLASVVGAPLPLLLL